MYVVTGLMVGSRGSSHPTALLFCALKQEVAYTAEREGEIGEIGDVKRVEEISVILRERDKSW